MHSFPLRCLMILSWLLPAAAPLAENADIRVLVVPVHEAKLASQLGERVDAIGFKVGERFKAGQTLVELDCRVRRAELAREQAELRSAKASLESNQKLRSLGSGSQLDLEVAQAKVDKAAAEVTRMHELLRQCTLKAPFDGRVHEVLVNPFESVRVGDPLLDILDDSDLRLDMFVPSNWLRWLRLGSEFKVNIAETERSYRARVSTIGARVDPVSRTVLVRGELLDPHPELLAGMSGRAEFEAAQ